MKVNKLILLSLLVSGHSLIGEMPVPFRDLSKIYPEDMYGWFSPANKRCLTCFIEQIKPKKAVEVGVWLGLSAIFMAELLDCNAKLYCIDPWLPYKDMENMPECQERLPIAYEQFLSNCIHHKVTNKIIPMRMPSMQAVKEFSNDIDLIYIDGSHAEEDVYDDIMHWYPKLSSKGILCGDDMGWPSVYKAVMRAASDLQVKIVIDENFWWLER